MAENCGQKSYEELREENERLLRELRFTLKCNQVLEKYRQLVFDFKNTCLCDQNIGNESKLNGLEVVYNAVKFPITRVLLTTGAEDYDHIIRPDAEEVAETEEERLRLSDNDSLCDDQSDDDYKPSIEELKKACSIDNEDTEELGTSADNDLCRPFLCDYDDCRKTFTTNGNLKKHQRTVHSDERPYRCSWPDCGAAYKAKDSLESHQVIHSNGGQYECPFEGCGKSFGSAKEVRLHSRAHRKCVTPRTKRTHSEDNGDDLGSVVVAKKRPKTATVRKKYVYFNYACDWEGCERRFGKRVDLLAHVSAAHTNEKPYPCPQCDKWFATEKYLQTHHKYHQRIGEKCSDDKARLSADVLRDYGCDYDDCGKSFKTMSNLNKHRRTVHSDDRPYICCWPGCGAAYKYNDSLLNHEIIHSTGGEFECDTDGCDKSFATIKELRLHRRCHRPYKLKNKRNYGCDWPGCAFKGRTKQDLVIHTNRHQNIKPFVCPTVGCPMRYYTSYELNQHVVKVHNVTDQTDREYKCGIDGCRLSYATERDLKRHRRRHDRIYRCSWPECGQSYSAKVLLSEHMDRHLNVKSHKCLYVGCGKQFFSKNNFETHMKNVHKKGK